MKRIINAYIFFTALIFSLSGCAVTEFDHSVNFNQYRTFGWGTADLSSNNPLYRGDLISRRIKSTIENEFAKRGIEYNASNPDFVVSYQTFTEKVQHNYYNGGGFYGPFSPFGYRFYPYGFGYGFFPYGGYGPSYPSSYTETAGTLVIDIADKKTGSSLDTKRWYRFKSAYKSARQD